jgi:hypothetical protein
MTHRFQFNRKKGESLQVEGVRVDIRGDLIIVVGVEGQPLASFAESGLSSWYRNRVAGER